MAGGRGILDADGRLLIRSDGTVDVCEDCCGYHRLFDCDGVGTNYYISPSDIDTGDGVRYSNACYTASAPVELPEGATVLGAQLFVVDANACQCNGSFDVRLTLNGLDGAYCSGCINWNTASGEHYTITSLSGFDGSYTLTTREDRGDWWRDTGTVGGSASVTLYGEGDPTCEGDPADIQPNTSGFRAFVTVSKDCCRITRIHLGTERTFGQPEAVSSFLFSQAAGAAFDAWVAGATGCGEGSGGYDQYPHGSGPEFGGNGVSSGVGVRAMVEKI